MRLHCRRFCFRVAWFSSSRESMSRRATGAKTSTFVLDLFGNVEFVNWQQNSLLKRDWSVDPVMGAWWIKASMTECRPWTNHYSRNSFSKFSSFERYPTAKVLKMSMTSGVGGCFCILSFIHSLFKAQVLKICNSITWTIQPSVILWSTYALFPNLVDSFRCRP